MNSSEPLLETCSWSCISTTRTQVCYRTTIELGPTPGNWHRGIANWSRYSRSHSEDMHCNSHRLMSTFGCLGNTQTRHMHGIHTY